MSQMHTHLLIALEKQNETMEAINDTLKFGQVPGKKGPHDYKAWVRRQYTATVEESVEILDCLLRRWKAGVQRSPPAYITEANASMLRGGATCVCHLHELDKNLAQTLMRSFFREVYGRRFGAATLCGQPMVRAQLHPQSVKSSNDGVVFELRASGFEMGYIFAEEDQANPLAAQKRFQSAFPRLFLHRQPEVQPLAFSEHASQGRYSFRPGCAVCSEVCSASPCIGERSTVGLLAEGP
ncbi:uncharacterized protein PG998_014979 [Apiospora kogelbergensis]|uniref:uncharacterized protein n=1 Tax=Apiospora kogelbergensis TaxID=1337665 RepID=UPI00312D17F7